VKPAIVKKPKPAIAYARVDRIWPESTIVCVGSGPSLTADDVASCRGRARVIAVKDAIQACPWADVLYACGLDASNWWGHYGDTLASFPGLRYTLDPAATKWAQLLRNTGEFGLEPDPSGVRHGQNSGYQAINLAVHLGARRIVLLGYDMGHSPHGQKYFFGNRRHVIQVPSPFAKFIYAFETLVEPLARLGICVLNASRQTALTVFPRVPLEEAWS
jgi:hypothetical protein